MTARHVSDSPLFPPYILKSYRYTFTFCIAIKLNPAINDCVGWAFVCEGSGFADKIKLVLTVDAAFENLVGFGVLASNETPGFGDKIKNNYFRTQFIKAPATKLVLSKTGDDKKIDSEIVAITGATVSSEAVVKILNNYIRQIKTYVQEEGLLSNDE